MRRLFIALVACALWAQQPNQLLPSSSSTFGLSMFDNSGTNVTTVVSVKSSAGNLYGWFIGNTNATVCYVQIFNVASGSVTLGTTAPNLTLPIPATSGANLSLVIPIAFGTAISVASTTTATGATTTGCGQTINFWYQ
jgi:hypothetical protein